MKKNKHIDVFIGKKLKELRKKHGLTQSKLAGLLEVSHQQVQQYEIGETRISANTIYELSQLFNVQATFFYNGLEEKVAIKNSIAQDGIICAQRYRPLKILLVEDSPREEVLIREAISTSEEDVLITSIQDGDDAIEFLRNCSNNYHDEKRPDLVLLDINLPKRSGSDVLKFIKKSENLRDIQVVMMTNSINPDDMFATYNMFSSSYIKKSEDFDMLAETMRKLVSYWCLVVTPSMQYE